MRRSVSSLLLASFAAGCSSMSSGVASLQARGAVTGDSAYFNSDSGQWIEGGGVVDLNVRSYGVRASINSTYVDVIGGTDVHRIEGQEVQEATLGLRKRFPSTAPGAVYVEAAFRRGFDLETASGRTDYDGMEAGFGGIIQLDEHWFLDLGLSMEWTLGDLDLESGTDHLNEVVFSLGLGFSF